MERGVTELLGEAGIRLRTGERDYRPNINVDGVETKVLKPRAIVEMLDAGARDVGFAGADWIAESGAEVVELLDTGLDPVRLVAAAPWDLLEDGALPSGRRLVVASEYVNVTERWIAERGLAAAVLRSYGATEVLPPEDADAIVDNTASGATLSANRLTIIDELMRSSTRLYASRAAMESSVKRGVIESIALVVESVLQARKRVVIEFNVEAGLLEEVVGLVPCMNAPTVAPMHAGKGFAVKAAVLRSELPTVVPMLRARGGRDILVTTPDQIVV